MSGARGHAETSGGNGQEMLEELLGPFPVVRLRGLPFEAQVRDVILFFQVSSGVAHVKERAVQSGICSCRRQTLADMA
jgi:hypothetical protein